MQDSRKILYLLRIRTVVQLAREAVEFGDERCLVVVDSVLGQLHQMTHRLFAEMQLQIQIREIHL